MLQRIRLRSRYVFLIGALTLLLSPQIGWSAASSCKEIFSTPISQFVAPVKINELSYIGQPSSKNLAEIEHAQVRLRKSTQQLRAQSQKQHQIFLQKKNKTIELEFLCVGAGPASIAAAHAIPPLLRSKSLVVEASHSVAGTFANADFYINTPVEWTQIPQSKTIFHSSFKYPHSSQLAVYLQESLIESGMPLLLGATITEIKLEKDKKGRIVSVIASTDRGIIFKAKHLLLGTGMGEGMTKISDPEYQKLFKDQQKLFKSNSTRRPQVMHSDAFLAFLKQQSTQSSIQKVVKDLPTNMVLLGNGDGARISLEALAQVIKFLPENFKISWIGGPYKNAEEYLQSQKDFDRYQELIPQLFHKQMIQGYEGRSNKVTIKKDGSVEVLVVDKLGNENLVSIKGHTFIVDATGYSQKSSVLESFKDSFELKPVRAPHLKKLRDENGKVLEISIAQQVYLEGSLPAPIHLIGSAAGGLATKAETVGQEVQNPVAIYNNVDRVQALVKNLLP